MFLRGRLNNKAVCDTTQAPVVIALCANSAVYEGAAQPFCSAREVLMSKTYGTPERYGMIGADPPPSPRTFPASLRELN